MENRRYDVAVVGSGFSAIAQLIHLLLRLPSTASVAVIGDDPGFGRGTAYRTELHIHRLNVPAQRMSIFPDMPDDFLDWLRSEDRVPSDGFAPRETFGLYLRDRLASLLRNRERRASLQFIKAKAVSCERTGQGFAFALDSGAVVEAFSAVLCLGIGNADLPVEPAEARGLAYGRVIRNPWRLGWLSRVGERDVVCILGSGLTMVDQVLALRLHGHRGPIHILSRRGLLPHPHHRGKSEAIVPALPRSWDISAILASLRAQVRAGANWRCVMDGLRPMTQDLWKELSRDARGRFLRHALAWWNIHRHRLAPDVADALQQLIDSGVVTVHGGFLQEISEENGALHLNFRRRGANYIASLRTDWVINCTGMERAGIGHSPLLQQMLTGGLIRADDLALGICVDDRSRVLDGEGMPQAGLFAVGALTAGTFWEITAVPDIRVQAAGVASRIADDLSV